MIIGNGIWIGRNSGGGVNWTTYWATLISATVENAAPTHVVLTFPTAQASLVDTDITCTVNGAARMLSSASWTGGVWTIVLASAVLYGDVVVMTFVPSTGTTNVVNNVTHPLILEDDDKVAWWDTLSVGTITKDGSELVAAIADRLGGANTLAQATATNKPTYSGADGGEIIFDGVDNWMRSTFTFNQPEFLYLVIKQLAWTADDCLWDGVTFGKAYTSQVSGSPNIYTYAGNFSSQCGDLLLNKWLVVKCLYNGVSSKLQVGNLTAITGDFGAANMGGITIGGDTTYSTYAYMSLKDIILRKVADSAPNEKTIYEFLRRRHSLGRPRAELLILAGQSNAIGYFPEDILPVGYEGDQDNILIHHTSFSGSYFDKMNPAVNCGHDTIADPDDKTGWSVEQTACHELQTDTNNKVILVKNGTSSLYIADWDTGQSYYTDLSGYIKKMLVWHELEYSQFGTLSFLWMQGESDLIQTQVYYEAKLRDLISRVRALDDRLANLQFVFCKLPLIMTEGVGDRDVINNSFAAIAADTDNCVVLDTDSIVGLAMRPDNLHYTAASLLLIGSAWRDLMDTNNVIIN